METSNDTKYFMWFTSDRPDVPMFGPISWYDTNAVGLKLYHSLDDMLKLNICESLKKRLISAKLNTKIKFSYYSSRGDLMVMSVNNEKVKLLDSAMQIINEINATEKIIKQMEIKLDNIYQEIININ